MRRRRPRPDALGARWSSRPRSTPGLVVLFWAGDLRAPSRSRRCASTRWTSSRRRRRSWGSSTRSLARRRARWRSPQPEPAPARARAGAGAGARRRRRRNPRRRRSRAKEGARSAEAAATRSRAEGRRAEEGEAAEGRSRRRRSRSPPRASARPTPSRGARSRTPPRPAGRTWTSTSRARSFVDPDYWRTSSRQINRYFRRPRGVADGRGGGVLLHQPGRLGLGHRGDARTRAASPSGWRRWRRWSRRGSTRPSGRCPGSTRPDRLPVSFYFRPARAERGTDARAPNGALANP